MLEQECSSGPIGYVLQHDKKTALALIAEHGGAAFFKCNRAVWMRLKLE